MKTDPYCPFCHILVAPADPGRLVRNGRTAHEGCVKRVNMPSVRAACTAFVASADAFEASVFGIKAKTAVTPKAFAKLVAWTLQRILAGSGAQAAAEVATLAAETADKLFVDVTVDGAGAAPLAAAVSQTQSA